MKPHASLQSFALAVMTAALLGLPLAGCKDAASPAGKNAGKAIRDFKEETSAAPGVADNVTADDARA